MKGKKSLAVAMAHLLAASGCATTPATYPTLPPAAPGHQVIRFWAATWAESIPDFPGMARTYSTTELPGVRCRARNAKGTWEVTTPGQVEVAIGEGAGDLTIDCDLEGYRSEHKTLSCITPRARSTASGAMAGLSVFNLLGPAAVVAAPAAVIAGLVGLTAAGAAAGSATAGPDPDVCNYAPHGYFGVVMTRQ